jgi:hypothetical protein
MHEKGYAFADATRAHPYSNDAANIAGALGFETRSQPSSLAPTLVILPSMSRVPRTPFTKTESSASLDRLGASRTGPKARGLPP